MIRSYTLLKLYKKGGRFKEVRGLKRKMIPAQMSEATLRQATFQKTWTIKRDAVLNAL